MWPYCLWSALNGDAGNDGGIEMTAIAWPYAAAVHLGIEIEVLFHPDGYKGGAEWLAGNSKPAVIAFSGLLQTAATGAKYLTKSARLDRPGGLSHCCGLGSVSVPAAHVARDAAN